MTSLLNSLASIPGVEVFVAEENDRTLPPVADLEIDHEKSRIATEALRNAKSMIQTQFAQIDARREHESRLQNFNSALKEHANLTKSYAECHAPIIAAGLANVGLTPDQIADKSIEAATTIYRKLNPPPQLSQFVKDEAYLSERISDPLESTAGRSSVVGNAAMAMDPFANSGSDADQG